MSETVQRATEAHAGVLAAIHAAAFPPAERWGADAFALQLALPGVFGLLDARGGVLLARVAAEDAEVLTLAVAPDRRRLGIGRTLLTAAIAEVRRRGATALFLEVATANVAAQALYREAGLTEAARRRRYYPDGSDAIVLRMNLS